MTATHPRAAILALTALLVCAVAPSPAVAHPFGPPLMADLDADGATVTVTWTAAEDDWLNLGQHVGAFESDPDSDELLTGEQRLQQSQPLRRYLAQHISVRQAGNQCPGDAIELRRLLSDGALLTFACPEPVETVDVTVSALSDVNAAYRTVVTAEPGASPGRAMLTKSAASQEFTFGEAAATGWSRGLLTGLTVLLVLAATGVTFVVARTARFRRKSA